MGVQKARDVRVESVWSLIHHSGSIRNPNPTVSKCGFAFMRLNTLLVALDKATVFERSGIHSTVQQTMYDFSDRYASQSLPCYFR